MRFTLMALASGVIGALVHWREKSFQEKFNDLLTQMRGEVSARGLKTRLDHAMHGKKQNLAIEGK